MKKLAFCFALALSSSPAWAVDNSTTTYNGGTHNLGGTFSFPSPDGTNNTLQIIGGALVYNTQGILGDGSTANTNFALISGTGSTWSNASTVNSFFVGHFGSGNQLTVESGGELISVGSSFIGNNGHNNSVLVTGSGSKFTGGVLYLGNNGSLNTVTIHGGLMTLSGGVVMGNSAGAGNTLILTNGGRLINTSSFTASETSASTSNQTIIVTGTGSVLSNSGSLLFGRTGAGNTMEISSGGLVVNAIGYIGPTFASGSNNSVLLTGSGSVWSNTSSLIVGNASANNSLTVRDSATAYAADLQLGGATMADHNIVLITNAGKVFVSGNVTLSENHLSNSNNTLIVSGANSRLQSGGTLFVGRIGRENRLVVEDGGTVINGVGFLGATASSSSNNTALVTGPGSVWSNTSTLYVGNVSADNSLTVNDSGRVYAADVFLGQSSSSPGNTILVTNGGKLYISSAIIFGESSSSSSNNTLIVSGAGSVVTNGSNLLLGRASTGNRLIVENGGTLLSATGFIGPTTAPGSNNIAVVTGSGSVWSNTSYLYVGHVSPGNQLSITNGGKLYSPGAYVGTFATATDNAVRIHGAGSLWQSSATIYIGNNGTTLGAGNSITIQNGGTLEAPGLNAGASSVISNTGGVYQFATASPSISTNATGTITLHNGTISYRDVTAADINNADVAKITRTGDNTFQLKRATNVSVATYTFDSAANTFDPSVYQRLALAEGSRWQSTTLRIGSGGALIGNGTVASSSVTNLGTIAPGFSAGQLTFTGDLVLGSSSTLEMEIGGASTAAYDQLIVLGDVTLAGALDILMINSFSPTPGQTFTLIDNLGANLISGQFAGLTNNQFIDASVNGIDAYFRIQYNAGTGGNDLVLLATVPEPSALLLVFLAGVAALARRRR
jgi:T5SS/PEP-CTERM-associated repeat protein